MLTMQLSFYLALALWLPFIQGCRFHKRGLDHTPELQSIPNSQSIRVLSKPVPLVKIALTKDITINANTSSATSALEAAAPGVVAQTVSSTVLVLARDATSAYSAYSGLNDYGIPYSLLVVPSAGVNLPRLNDSATLGNFGLIVVLSEVSYLNSKTGSYQSALTDAQWTSIFNYQVSFGVRLVRLDAFPSADTGTTSLGGCCTKGDQLVSISNDAAFPLAGLKTGAGLTTTGLWHYPASISNTAIATEFAQFAAATDDPAFKTKSTAGVINKIKGREQMVFFLGFSTEWSITSNFLQHAWIQWGTRSVYSGYRRALLTPQVDDMFLETPMYDAPKKNIRVTGDDLDGHVTWIKKVKAKLNSGSDWFIEIGHNGNGNIEKVDTMYDGEGICSPGPVDYPEQIDTPLEWAKPIGSGTNLYPATPTAYPKYPKSCTDEDPLLNWFQDTTNLNSFAHVSHTFTHQDENNATYSDVYKEITWNKGWLDAVGISKAKKWSPAGIIPPAITGLHNGDALRAWTDAGITKVVGDNTRPVLLSQVNEHWPIITTSANGFAGIQITPRWATNIYYNCDLPACTLAEWKNTSAGSGTFQDLLNVEKDTSVRHLLGLHKDAFMFHQANMWWDSVPTTTINGVKGKYSLLMAWVETVVTEYNRLVTWPILSLKHDDLGASFLSRMNRDACKPNLSWTLDPSQHIITGVSVTATGNTCKELIPITLPGPVRDAQGFKQEQLGKDPLTIWVTLSGKPVNFTFTTPISVI